MGKVSHELQRNHTEGSETACCLFSGQTLLNGLGFPIPRSWYLGHPVEKDEEMPICSVQLSKKDLKRLELVKSFLERIEFLSNHNDEISDYGNPLFRGRYVGHHLSDFFHQCSGYPMTSREANFRRQVVSPSGIGTRSWCQAALGFIPLAYGCVHLAARTMVFPTPIERSLWQYSCFYLLASTIALAIKILCIRFDHAASSAAHDMLRSIRNSSDGSDNFDLGPISPIKYVSYAITKRHVKVRPETKEWPALNLSELWHTIEFDMVLKSLKSLLKNSFQLSLLILRWIKLGINASIGVPYLAVRIFIVAESFLSLRHVPVGVYQTPDLNIMGLIPHI